jgi:hypothetical protein
MDIFNHRQLIILCAWNVPGTYSDYFDYSSNPIAYYYCFGNRCNPFRNHHGSQYGTGNDYPACRAQFVRRQRNSRRESGQCNKRSGSFLRDFRDSAGNHHSFPTNLFTSYLIDSIHIDIEKRESLMFLRDSRFSFWIY